MKIAIVGLGLRTANVINLFINYIPHLKIVGYVDPSPCGLNLLKKKKFKKF